MFAIEINNRQSHVDADLERMRAAVAALLEEEGLESAAINIALVDDRAIHDLNRRFLDHDEATDVLSFLLDDSAGLEGDVVASAETALRSAARFGWPADDELLLYVVHGTLHLIGYDDRDAAAQGEMRSREKHYLAALGIQVKHDEPPMEQAGRVGLWSE
ncbi:MAG TPA: rRNA maturation RNase YbeY [Pirellulales bacterium]|jgi:probable rRNA maturation factor|nr:rRNA maturation RNase YbeY [Pirellulales bacterium]